MFKPTEPLHRTSFADQTLQHTHRSSTTTLRPGAAAPGRMKSLAFELRLGGNLGCFQLGGRYPIAMQTLAQAQRQADPGDRSLFEVKRL